MAIPIKNYVGAPLGSGEQWQSWIHIHDLARIYLFVIEHKLEGVYNAVAPNPVTNSKLTREIAHVLHKPLILPNVPEYMLKLFLGEMAYMLVSSQRVSSKKIENSGYSFEHANIRNALEALYQSGQSEPSGAATLHKEYRN
jgi:NAD dependent epimerase/dehydratase family enzyme